MIATWMLYAVIVSALAGVAARSLSAAARALSRPTRYAWAAAMVYSAVWPLWSLALGATRDRALPGAALLDPLVIAATRGSAAMNSRFPAGLSAMVIALWGVASSVLLARLVYQVSMLRRRRDTWQPRVVDGVPVLVAPDVGPAVVGVRRSRIVLPEWTMALDPGLRALVLRHETEHVGARDPLLRVLGAVVTALMPWNPALWWQANRLTLAVEVDCDARVLRADSRRERYGLLLLAIAQHQSSSVGLAPALTERVSHLQRRITAMQSSMPRRPVPFAIGLGATAAIAIIVACSTPAPNATVAPAPEPAATPGAGASTARTPQSTEKPFVEFKLSKMATPLPGQPGPRYPDELRKARVEGEVLAQFVVNPDGTVDMSTFKVVKASDPAFVEPVKTALATWRWEPADVSGRKVRQLVQMPFQFSLAK